MGYYIHRQSAYTVHCTVYSIQCTVYIVQQTIVINVILGMHEVILSTLYVVCLVYGSVVVSVDVDRCVSGLMR